MKQGFCVLLVLFIGCSPNDPTGNIGKKRLRQFNMSNVIAGHSDNPSHPKGVEQGKRRDIGMQAKLHGKAKGKTHKVAKGQYVELAREGEDSIWTLLVEFGDIVIDVPDWPAGGNPGPMHNEIPQPDRDVDNSTIWTADFSPGYYETMLFDDARGANSMRNFYIEQSANRYTVNGEVTDWVKVPFNEALYGTNICGGIVCSSVWWMIEDGVNTWYAAQIAAGKTKAEIVAYLSKFDVWDRYDQDGDGNFNEPDGYIDHFQAVHAGEGEETGGGAQGANAIWSHRWYANFPDIYVTGPTGYFPQGGIQIGDTDIWIGDYTIEPENGGVGVFAHEFGHDLGLPDLYDTSGNTGGASNSTGFWTLYSSGSYGSTGIADEGIGSKPVPMSAYEKIMLGWANYVGVPFNKKTSIKMGPANANTKRAQQVVVFLPDKTVESFVGLPFGGTYFYHSGAGNDLVNTMTREVTLPTGLVEISAKVRYSIETDWDYAYLIVNGVPVETNLSDSTNPNGQNFGHGITGSSNGWVDLTADLSAFAGETVSIGFLYWTDVAVVGPGFGVDDISITGLPMDDGESDMGWTYDGFVRTNGIVSKDYFNAYFAEFRTYTGYDEALKTGPYNFTSWTWVEHYPYQDGLLVWYYDTSFKDNNVGDNCAAGRCGGMCLPVDAHPDLMLRPNGMVWSPRVQSYDSTFNLDMTDEICLHSGGTATCYGGLPGNPMFDDTKSYWVDPDPSIGHFGWASVPLPGFGATIRVNSVAAHNTFMQVTVAPKK